MHSLPWLVGKGSMCFGLTLLNWFSCFLMHLLEFSSIFINQVCFSCQKGK